MGFISWLLQFQLRLGRIELRLPGHGVVETRGILGLLRQCRWQFLGLFRLLELGLPELGLLRQLLGLLELRFFRKWFIGFHEVEWQ